MSSQTGVLNYPLWLICIVSSGWVCSDSTSPVPIVMVEMLTFTPLFALMIFAVSHGIADDIHEAAQINGANILSYRFTTLSVLRAVYVGMIWVYQVIELLAIFWLSRSYIEDIHRGIQKSAEIGFEKSMLVLFHIVLPLIRQGLIGVSRLVFLMSWHNFALGLMFRSESATITALLLKSLNPGLKLHSFLRKGLW